MGDGHIAVCKQYSHHSCALSGFSHLPIVACKSTIFHHFLDHSLLMPKPFQSFSLFLLTFLPHPFLFSFFVSFHILFLHGNLFTCNHFPLSNFLCPSSFVVHAWAPPECFSVVERGAAKHFLTKLHLSHLRLIVPILQNTYSDWHFLR
jgi:hypothetical protein